MRPKVLRKGFENHLFSCRNGLRDDAPCCESGMGHEMQHENGPTWCVHCGTFDIYANGECEGERTRAFDSSVSKNRERVFRAVYGYGAGELDNALKIVFELRDSWVTAGASTLELVLLEEITARHRYANAALTACHSDCVPCEIVHAVSRRAKKNKEVLSG